MNRSGWVLWTLVVALSGGCASSRPKNAPRDPALADAMHAAAKAFREGQPDRAERFYREALQRARAADDPVAVRDAATSLGLVLAAYGFSADALALVDEARAAGSMDGSSMAPVDVVEARIAWSAGDLERARQAAGRVLDSGSRPEMYVARVVLAEVAFASGDGPGLEEQADALVRSSLRGPLAAERLRVEGYRYQMAGRYGLALDHFGREAEAWHRLDRYEDQARAQRRAAAMAAQAGRFEEALDRTYRSIRSFHALGRTREAADLIPGMEPLMTQAGWSDLPGHWLRLFDEVVPPAPTPSTP